MKILLVSPNTRMSNDGLRLIAALLRRDGHQLQMITVPNPAPKIISDEKLKMLGEFTMEADLVMIGVYSLYEQHVIRITKYLKSIRPDRLIIWGGPHCIGQAEESLQYADGVCYSEGDIAVPQFVSLLESGNKDYLQTANMAFRINDTIQINPLLPLFDDLDSLPFYDYSFENEWVLYQSFVPVNSAVFANNAQVHPFKHPTISFLFSRGCPHNCSYCSNIRYLTMYRRTKIRSVSINLSLIHI